MIKTLKNVGFDKILKLLPVISCISIVIVVMGYHQLIFDPEVSNVAYWEIKDEPRVDFYNYSKMCWFVGTTIFALLNLVFDLILGKFEFKRIKKIYISLGLFAVLILLSFVFSPYKQTAMWGYGDHFEGTIVWLCYLFMIFYTIHVVDNATDVKIILASLIFFVTLISVMGVFQTLGMNFFNTELFKNLLIPESVYEFMESGPLVEDNSASQTVYNINYVSFYIAILIPIFTFLLFNAKAVWKKIFYIIFLILLIYNLIGSNSSGGYLGVFAAILAALALFRTKILFWWKEICIMIVFALLFFIPNIELLKTELSQATGKRVTTSDTIIGNDVFFNNPTPEGASYVLSENRIKINYIKTSKDGFVMDFDDKILEVKSEKITDQELKIACFDGQGKRLELKESEMRANSTGSAKWNVYYIMDKRYESSLVLNTIVYDKQPMLLMNTPKKDWRFVFIDEEVLYLNAANNLIALDKVPSMGFENNPEFGTGRGYIWSRTFPLLKDTLLIGHGADTYCMYFPHDDYAGKYNSRIADGIIFDKPHNFYLNIFVNTGGLSLLVFIALIGFYLVDSVKIYSKIKKDSSFLQYCGAGIFLGTICFAISAIVNDSNLSIMPMFFGLFGMGNAINYIIRNQELSIGKPKLKGTK